MPRRVYAIVFLVLILIVSPYLLAASFSNAEWVFKGFLLNPGDGFSYQAKMLQGWNGSWRFYLPFAAQPGQGGNIFLYYLFLGHLARWLGLPLLVIYHLARCFGAVALLASLWRFLKYTSPAGTDPTWPFALASLGLGMGWLVFAFGWILSDFWVVEAYPILSMFANPHFPLSLALLLWLLVIPATPGRSVHLSPARLAVDLLLTVLLGIVTPFPLVVCLLVLGGWLLWEIVDHLRSQAKVTFHTLWRSVWPADGAWPAPLVLRLGVVLLGGGPVMIHYLWSVYNDAALTIWNAQNLTWTPAAWDVVLALSPALLLAAWGAAAVLRDDVRPGRLLVVWLVLGLIFIYLPFDLQRRFMLGLYVPAAGLAGYAVDSWRRTRPRLAHRAASLGLALSLPTLGLLLLVSLFGITTRDPKYYLPRATQQALAWMAAQTPRDALVLAAPETGMLIPAYTGQRVIYGHPYETPDAEVERAAAEQFFQIGQVNGQPAEKFLDQRQVDFIFYGPEERLLGSLPAGLPLVPVYQSGAVTVYQWKQVP